jgi:hypothetical protein
MSYIGLLYGSNDDVHISGAIIEEYHRFEECSTTTQLYRKRAKMYYEKKLSEGNEECIIMAWPYEKAIDYFAQPECDHGPFPLRHPDLNCCHTFVG